MAILYGDVLRAARDASVWFDPSRIPGGTAARLAAGVQRDLIGLAMQRDPERLSTTTTLTGASVVASLGTPPTPIVLPDAFVYIRAQIQTTGSTLQATPLRLITADRLTDWPGRGWFVEAANAYFTGVAADWSTVANVLITYIPFATDFTSETTPIAMTSVAFNAFCDGLALQFALRVNGMPISTDGADQSAPIRLDVNAFQKAYDDSLAQFLMQLSMQRRQSRLPIRNGADFL